MQMRSYGGDKLAINDYNNLRGYITNVSIT